MAQLTPPVIVIEPNGSRHLEDVGTHIDDKTMRRLVGNGNPILFSDATFVKINARVEMYINADAKTSGLERNIIGEAITMTLCDNDSLDATENMHGPLVIVSRRGLDVRNFQEFDSVLRSALTDIREFVNTWTEEKPSFAEMNARFSRKTRLSNPTNGIVRHSNTTH